MSYLLWRMGLVINHNIRIVAKVTEHIDPVKGFLQRTVIIGKDVYAFQTVVFNPCQFIEFDEKMHKVFFWVIPCKVEALRSDFIQQPNAVLCCKTDIQSLSEIYLGPTFCKLSEQDFLLLTCQ